MIDLLPRPILDRSKTFLAQARAEAKAEVLEYLNYFDCPSRETYEASSTTKKAEINLTQFYQDYGFTPDDAPRIDFEEAEHAVLKQHFLQDFFDVSTVRFFSSLTLEQLDHAFETEQQMAAVVAMDRKKMVLLWFNY